MQSCPHGSRPKPGAPPGLGIVYFSDLGFPLNGPPSSPVTEYDGRNVSIDGTWLAGKLLDLFGNADPEYNLFPLNEAKDPIGFCEAPPSINDVAPGLPEYARQAVLYEMQRRWNQWCECMPPPVPGPCSDPRYQGRGQCECASYRFTVRATRFNPFQQQTFTRDSPNLRGPIEFFWERKGTYQSGGQTYQFVDFSYRSGAAACGGQGITDLWITNALASSQLDFEILQLQRRDGQPDNCCPSPEPPPTPEPDPFTPDNRIRIIPPGEDDVAIILIQGFCDPSACTTQVGPTGPIGPIGPKGDKGDPGEPQNITTNLEILDRDSTENSSFTVDRSGDTWALNLKLKMDTKTANRIYNILGGDSWNFDANDNPTTTPTENPGSSIIKVTRDIVTTGTETGLDLVGNLVVAALRAQVEAIAKVNFGVDLNFGFGDLVTGKPLFDRALNILELVNKIIDILNGLKDLFDIGEGGEPPDIKDLRKILEDIKDCACYEAEGEYLLGCPGDETRVPARFSGEGVELIHKQIEALAQVVNVARNQACDMPEPIAAVPEWWQVRPEGSRSQLIVQFGQDLGDGKVGSPKYPLTIPHFNTSYDISEGIPIPPYRKGQWEGILTLADNSKVIVNAYTPEIAEMVLTSIKPLIRASMTAGSFMKIGERKGQALSNIVVVPKIAKYFSVGVQNTKPDWVVYYGSR